MGTFRQTAEDLMKAQDASEERLVDILREEREYNREERQRDREHEEKIMKLFAGMFSKLTQHRPHEMASNPPEFGMPQERQPRFTPSSSSTVFSSGDYDSNVIFDGIVDHDYE